MKLRKRHFLIGILSALVVMSCMLPGMIPLKSESTLDGKMPIMETDTNKVLEVLSGTDWQPLQALATEQYTDEEYAKPGTLTYTVTITNDLPTYFSYGWCAVDEGTLRQNYEHIDVKLYINEEEFPPNAIHSLSFTSSNNLLCLDSGALLSDWPEGKYTLEAVATFDETVNDGLDDYAAGDYIFVYNITVQKSKEGAFAPSGSIYKTVFQ